jgi:hypothetical protein
LLKWAGAHWRVNKGPDGERKLQRKVRIWMGQGGAAMLIMYRGFEVVPVKVGDVWQAQISSGGRPTAATPTCTTEEQAMREARKIADGIRDSRRSA